MRTTVASSGTPTPRGGAAQRLAVDRDAVDDELEALGGDRHAEREIVGDPLHREREAELVALLENAENITGEGTGGEES